MQSIQPGIRLSRSGWAAAVAVILAVAAGAAVGSHLREPFAGALHHGFALVCHQLDSRSFAIASKSMLVCHRCIGILLGMLFAAVIFPVARQTDGFLWRYARTIIVLSLVPMGMDWSLDIVGAIANTPVSRVVTGVFFGLAAGYFTVRGIALCRVSRPLRENPGTAQSVAEAVSQGSHRP